MSRSAVIHFICPSLSLSPQGARMISILLNGHLAAGPLDIVSEGGHVAFASHRLMGGYARYHACTQRDKVYCEGGSELCNRAEIHPALVADQPKFNPPTLMSPDHT